ncbi:MAG: PKD domain-containing protein [Promethearchaeota archaeon]
MGKKNKFSIILILFISFISINVVFIIIGNNNSSFYSNNKELLLYNENKDIPTIQSTYKEYYTEEWLDNPTFTKPVTQWFNISTGDNSDVNASLAGEEARYEVLGNKTTYTFYSDLTQDRNWNIAHSNNVPTYPDVHVLNNSGACVSHYWIEDANQSVAVNWNRTINMPIDMSDYTITSANISATFNASVQSSPSLDDSSIGGAQFTGAVDVMSDSGIDQDPTQPFQGSTGDYVRFYILISDTEGTFFFEIAYNQTYNLGQDLPEISTISDKLMKSIPESFLIFYLESVLSKNHKNFTITIGMHVFCEDNFAQDADFFKLLIIKDVNLTFTYEKKISQQTTLSWNQIGKKISGSDKTIQNATLNFKYKVDKPWSSQSPNSKLRIIINGTQHSEVIDLIDAPTTYVDAKDGGFDVTYLIKKDVNISLSIQLYIADNFILNETTTVSIDNVSLQISYSITKNEEQTSLISTLNGEAKSIIQIPIGETVNVTVLYNDSSGFIPDANVVLYGYGTPKVLDQKSILEFYNITIDTSGMSLGEHYYTISASKYTYETKEISITIDVIKRNSYIDNLKLNDTETHSLSIPWDEELNISVSYNDTLTDNFINSATVELVGAISTKTLTQTGQRYNISINTRILDIGPNFLTITAYDENHTLSSETITIIVNERETELSTYLNQSANPSIQIAWNENLNITAIYRDINTNAFIPGAEVYLKQGTVILETLLLHPLLPQYNITINTADLGVGIHILSIQASKDNYSISFKSITITITNRETSLVSLLNQTQTSSIEISWNEILNITALYNDKKTGDLIYNANIYLKDGTSTLKTLVLHPSLPQYNCSLNTSILEVGVHVLTIQASKNNYTSAINSITINVIDRNAEIEAFLNQTQTSSIEISWNEILNITALYNDKKTGDLIYNANIYLKEGTSTLKTLVLHPSFPQYNCSLNTSILGIGVHSLTIQASKKNYTTVLISLTITVLNRTTDLEVYLNKTLTTSIEIAWNEKLNITTFYNDLKTSNFINNADIYLKDGTSTLKTLNLHPSLPQYNCSLNTSILGIGVHSLTIIALRSNYTSIVSSITINVIERQTKLKIILNQSETTTIQFPYDTELNITVFYLDLKLDNLIQNANIELREDETLIDVLAIHPTLLQYNLTLNTRILGVGVSTLIVYAIKDNYSISLSTITINVDKIDTSLDVVVKTSTMLNSLNVNDFTRFNISVGEILNITAFYRDYNNSLVPIASIEMTELKISDSLTKHPIYDQYNISMNALDFGIGIKFITISAQKDNFKAISLSFTLYVSQRNTTLELKVNGTRFYEGDTVPIEVEEFINITVKYNDLLLTTPIATATVELLDRGILNYQPTYEQFYIIIHSSTLNQGNTYLSILAEEDGYESRTINFLIQITERSTNVTLFLNGEDKTNTQSIKLTIEESVNISLLYEDKFGTFISAAEVVITGEEITATNLTKHPVHDLYNITIDTLDLGLGINVLTLYAYKTNYEQHTIKIVIEIISKSSRMDIFINQINRTIEKFEEIPLNAKLTITIRYLNNGVHIPGANITIRYGATLIILEEDVDKYTKTFSTESILDIGVRILSIEAQRANYQSQTENIRISVRRIQGEVTTEDGEKKITIRPGESFTLKIVLNDLDYGGRIKGATVSYTWEFGNGKLTDKDNDGVYEVTFENVPEGSYTITITVYAGDDYEFERYEFELNAVRPEEEYQLWLALGIAGIIGGAAVTSLYILNLRIFSVPKEIRKLRKFRKNLRKDDSSIEGVKVKSRETSIKKMHANQMEMMKKYPKARLEIEERGLLHDKVEMAEQVSKPKKSKPSKPNSGS